MSYELATDHPISAEPFDPTDGLEVEVAPEVEVDGDPVEEKLARGMRMPRYNAGTEPVILLGTHVENVRKLLEKQGERKKTQFYGLHHDSGEVYLGDIVRPVKDIIDGFDEREEAVLKSLWDYYGVEPPTEEEWEKVMAADDQVLMWEIRELYNKKRADEIIHSIHTGNSWDREPYDLIGEAGQVCSLGDSMEEARQRFVESHGNLLEDLYVY